MARKLFQYDQEHDSGAIKQRIESWPASYRWRVASGCSGTGSFLRRKYDSVWCE